jgi:flagellar hook protein FlgE
MNALPAIALSGMSAAMLRLDSAAHNIANAQTPGLRRQQVAQQALPGGGVQATSEQSSVPGANLIEDIVGQKAAAIAFKANVQVFRTGDAVLGTLLDIQA